MRYNTANPGQAGDWTIYEVVKNGRCLCSSEYDNARIEDIHAILAKLRILQAAGFPPDRERGFLKIQKVGSHHTGHLGNISIHVLKIKPGPWRLYFYVASVERREIALLWSVAKKTHKRDPADLVRCCRILDDIANGYTTRERIILPNR
jgi:hypothetical protein